MVNAPTPSRPRTASARAGATVATRPPARYAAPALDRGLDIVEALADAPDGLKLNQLGETLGRRPAEVFRVVVRLHERGYLRRGPDDAYHLSARLLALAHRHTPTRRLLDAAMPVMSRLAARVGQSCHLAQLHRPELVVVAEVAGSDPLCLTVRTGSSHPPAATTSGRLLLAFEGSGEVPADERRRLTTGRVVRRASRVVRGVIDLSAPVFDHTGRPVAALTIPMLLPRESNDAPALAAAELAAAAAHLSKALGCLSTAPTAATTDHRGTNP